MIENGLARSQVALPRPILEGGRRARFGFFGKLAALKGFPLLLDVVARVPEAVWGDDAGPMVFGGNLENQPEAFRNRVEKLMQAAAPASSAPTAAMNCPG